MRPCSAAAAEGPPAAAHAAGDALGSGAGAFAGSRPGAADIESDPGGAEDVAELTERLWQLARDQQIGGPPPDAQRLWLKAGLAARILYCLQGQGLTQQRAARSLGLTQPRISGLDGMHPRRRVSALRPPARSRLGRSGRQHHPADGLRYAGGLR